jgi:hypothetical protein
VRISITEAAFAIALNAASRTPSGVPMFRAPNFARDLLDDARIPAFAEIRNAFDQFHHVHRLALSRAIALAMGAPNMVR